jgi:4-amino-4-deoxy-L-arabinose transferase-like glycosyltransferase
MARPVQTYVLWFLLLAAAAVFLGAGLPSQGFWEAPAVTSATEIPSQVPRQRTVAEPNEFSRFLELEEASSSSWPPLAQWTFRGAARLGSPVEVTTRLPSLVSMGLSFLALLLFLRRFGRPWEAWWAGIALASMPLFLLLARTLQPDVILVLCHTATVFFLYGAAFDAATLRRRVLYAVLSVLGLVGGVLSGGWIWGAVAAPACFGAGLVFSCRRLGVSRTQALAVLGMLAGAIGLFFLLRPVMGPWFFPEPNPALAVPSAKAPHAVFTAFIVRAVFGTFPWSVIAFVGLFADTEDNQSEKSTAPGSVPGRFFAGWLFASLMIGAYYEMRVGPVSFSGLVPVAGLAAIALNRARLFWWMPASALLLGLSSLLIFRDFGMYPQILPELAAGSEIPAVRLRLGPWILPAGLALVLPLLRTLWCRLEGFGEGWVTFWRELRRQSVLFFLMSWPPDLLGRGLRWCWRHRPARGVIGDRLRSLKARIPAAQRWAFFASAFAFLSYGGWFSLHVIPQLTREFSSRSVFAKVARTAGAADQLAVYESSPRPAPVYAGRAATVLGQDADLGHWMRGEERRFFVFPARLLGKVDYLSRTAGWSYHLLGTDSLTYRLGVNRLPGGARDANPLLRFVHSEKPALRFSIQSNLENALEVVGYDVPRTASRGQMITVRLGFRVKRPLTADNKVFIHLDPPYGTRITADHEPVQGLLPTRYFAPGTYVVDEYSFRIPKVGFPVGRYGVYAGLFSGNSRVKITGGAHGGQDRIPLGSLDITPSRGLFSCK